MATAQGFTVNDNKIYKDTKMVDTFIEPHIFMNRMIRRRSELIKSSDSVKIDARYNFRPDRLAFEYYGQDFWYPAILVANNLGSILQFKANKLGFECKIPNINTIKEIMMLDEIPHVTLDDIVDEIFK